MAEEETPLLDTSGISSLFPKYGVIFSIEQSAYNALL